MGLFWYQANNSNASAPLNISYAVRHNPNITAHYEFCDGSSASRQNITDQVSNMNIRAEFYKELEEKDPGNYISRWSAKFTISALDEGNITGIPVFYIAKEGRLNQEQGFFNLSMNSRGDFFKVMHQVDNQTFESFEVGSDQQISNYSMIGLAVNESMAWQLDAVWRQNFSALNESYGPQNTTEPNLVLVRPNRTVVDLQVFVRYSKQKFSDA